MPISSLNKIALLKKLFSTSNKFLFNIIFPNKSKFSLNTKTSLWYIWLKYKHSIYLLYVWKQLTIFKKGIVLNALNFMSGLSKEFSSNV